MADEVVAGVGVSGGAGEPEVAGLGGDGGELAGSVAVAVAEGGGRAAHVGEVRRSNLSLHSHRKFST